MTSNIRENVSRILIYIALVFALAPILPTGMNKKREEKTQKNTEADRYSCFFLTVSTRKKKNCVQHHQFDRSIRKGKKDRERRTTSRNDN